MPDADTLASISYNLIVSAAVVYALAMVLFAAEWGFGWRGLAARGMRAQASAASGSTGGGAGVPSQTTRSAEGSTVALLDPSATSRDAGRLVRLANGCAEAPDDLDRAVKYGRIGLSLTVLAFVHTAGLVTRGVSRPVPWGNMYEFLTSGSAVAMAVFLFLLWRGQDVRWLGAFVVTPVLLALGFATVLCQVHQLMPACIPYWLAIHVVAAVIATGLLTVGTVRPPCTCSRRGEGAGGRPLPYVGTRQLPGAAVLDQLAYRIYAFAFPIWTFAIMAGAIWAESMEPLLGLGSQGDLVVHHLGCVRRLLHARDRGLEGPLRCDHRAGGLRLPDLQLHRCEHLDRRPPLLRGVDCPA
jgi:hypothetical protein